jgi:hypothetical protein
MLFRLSGDNAPCRARSHSRPVIHDGAGDFSPVRAHQQCRRRFQNRWVAGVADAGATKTTPMRASGEHSDHDDELLSEGLSNDEHGIGNCDGFQLIVDVNMAAAIVIVSVAMLG